MYKKAHAAIREDPEAKSSAKKDVQPKRYALAFSIFRPNFDRLRWFSLDIQAIMAKIKSPKKPHSMVTV